MFNYLADLAQSFTAHRVLLPAWLGCALHKAQAARLHKGASHKYIRKVPTGKTGKTGKPTFRYFYTVGGGAGLGHHDEFKVGAAFAVKDAGKAGHFHIVKMPGSGAEGITIRHDESGKTATITRAALRELLHNEHAEPLRQAKERAAATLEQAKKTGSPKQQERARAQAEKVGAKEKGGVGAFEFDKARASDFAGLWARTLDPAATRAQAANDYNKHLQTLAQSLHDIAPNDDRAREAFENHKEVFDDAFQRWADKAGALAGEGYKRGGVEASVYDTATMRNQAHQATVELLTVKDDARKVLAKVKGFPKKDDPTLFLQSKLKVAQDKLDKLQRLNEILNASPKGWVPNKAQFIDKLGLDDADQRAYGRTGAPTKTLNYLKQTIRDLDKKLYLMEEDEKRGVRESKAASEQQGKTPPASDAPKTEAEALAHVNALDLPEIDTRGGKGDWREKRHHMGDVSISATGPYATLNDAAKRSLARMWRARRLEDLGHASAPLWAQIKNDDNAVQKSPTKDAERAQATARRSKPRSRVDLPKPVVGPSGARLTAYEWQHKLVDDVDKRGEDRVRRVSDWDKAAPSEHTGRDIVHHFEVVMPDGNAQTVSAESALDLLGYTNKSDRAKMRGLADDMIEAAQVSARLGELEAANKRLEEAHAAVSADLSTPRAFRPARMEGMWAHHDIGDKSYKTSGTIWALMGDAAKRERLASLHRSFVGDLAAEKAGLNPDQVRELENGLRPARERDAELRERLARKTEALATSTRTAQKSLTKSLAALFGI